MWNKEKKKRKHTRIIIINNEVDCALNTEKTRVNTTKISKQKIKSHRNIIYLLYSFFFRKSGQNEFRI